MRNRNASMHSEVCEEHHGSRANTVPLQKRIGAVVWRQFVLARGDLDKLEAPDMPRGGQSCAERRGQGIGRQRQRRRRTRQRRAKRQTEEEEHPQFACDQGANFAKFCKVQIRRGGTIKPRSIELSLAARALSLNAREPQPQHARPDGALRYADSTRSAERCAA